MKKKVLGLLMVFVMAVTVVGCSGKESVRVFEGKTNGLPVTMTYTCKGDRVLKQTSETKMVYADYNIADKEAAEKAFASTVASLKELSTVEGYNDVIEFYDDYLIEKAEVDYTVADFNELKTKVGMSITTDNGKDAEAVSMKKSLEQLESNGFKEVTE